VTISLRRFSPIAFLLSASSRRNSLAACFALVLIVALMGSVAPAGAVVTTVGGTSVGLQPRTETLGEGEPASPFANENGNAILGGTSVYAVYWDPNDVFFDEHHEWLVTLDNFFQQLGADSGDISTVFGTLGQYRDRANVQASYRTVFKGSYTDSVKYPTAGCTDPKPLDFGAITCLTDAQLRAQLQSFITTHGLATGMNTVYDLITPPGVTVCLDEAATHCSDFSVSEAEEEKNERKSASYKNSFCSYHGDINPNAAVEGDASTILYAAVPWTAGTLGDGFEGSESLFYSQGYDCQDGGWNPEKVEEHREKARELTAEELKNFEGATAEQKEATLRGLRLEGPHQEEPNQAGKGEAGDYSTGLADLIINQIAEEQANIVTDPLLNGWQDSEGHEVTDKCRDVFANIAGPSGGEIGGSAKADEHTEAGALSNTSIADGRYYINNVFNLAAGKCSGGVALVPRFTAPNPVNANEIVGFDGMESSVGLLKGGVFGATGPPTTTYATFRWSFGDGNEASGFAPNSAPCEAPWLSPCAGSAFHSYQYGGVYHVKLTVTDIAGNVSAVEHEVTVNGPPAPTEVPSVGGSVGGSTPGGGSGSTPGVVPSVPNPVAAASVISQSLKSVLRNGLVVRYSVNEQVAGHFDVLLDRATARRLKITGTPAVNLPAGTPPELVIAKAILVTTKGGRSAVRIKFSKRTAARLAHTHKVKLTLRLIVRNASPTSPASTTVLSSFTLSH
jgi:hypothetical protein